MKKKAPPKPETMKQAQSRARSWRIFRLRALWHMGALLTGPRRIALQRLVDQELKLDGAEPQGSRVTRQRLELYERLGDSP